MVIPPAINILLGTACNKHCEYCMQPKHGSNKKLDAAEFASKLVSYIKAHYSSIYTIEYWGGEPLLYFDQIKTIHSALVDNDVQILRRPRIVTNGTLATREFADFCNKYKILVNLSWHDGSISNDSLVELLRLKQFYVTSVITHEHHTLETDIQGWQRIFDLGRNVGWQVYPMHCTDYCQESSYFTKQDIDEYFLYLEKRILTSQNHPFSKYILDHLFSTWYRRKVAFIEPKCYGQRNLSIDFSGNRYYCHHIMVPSNISENIFDKTKIIPINSAVDYSKFYRSEECQSCRLLDKCLGGCYLSNRHQEECYFVKKAYQFCIEHKDEIQD